MQGLREHMWMIFNDCRCRCRNRFAFVMKLGLGVGHVLMKGCLRDLAYNVGADSGEEIAKFGDREL